MTDFVDNPTDAGKLASDRGTADFFESVCKASDADAKIVANWINGDLSGALNSAELSIEQSPVDAEALASLLNRITDKTISGKIAKEVFTIMWDSGDSVDQIIEDKGLKQITDSGEIEFFEAS